jgi:hypothetical protein
MYLVKGCHDVNYLYRCLIIVIFSYATVMKIEEKKVWNICFALHSLFVAKMEK